MGTLLECSTLAGEPDVAFLRADLSIVCYGAEHLPWVRRDMLQHGVLLQQ